MSLKPVRTILLHRDYRKHSTICFSTHLRQPGSRGRLLVILMHAKLSMAGHCQRQHGRAHTSRHRSGDPNGKCSLERAFMLASMTALRLLLCLHVEVDIRSSQNNMDRCSTTIQNMMGWTQPSKRAPRACTVKWHMGT
jgi:hypothetical protein